MSELGKVLVLLFFVICFGLSAIGSMEGKGRYISHRRGSCARLEPHTLFRHPCKLLASTNGDPKHHPLNVKCGFDGDVPYRWRLGMETMG